MHPNVAKWIDLDKKLNETAPQTSEAWLKLEKDIRMKGYDPDRPIKCQL